MSGLFVAPAPKPKVSLVAVGVMTLVTAAVCMGLRLWWIEPLYPEVVPKGVAVLPFAVLFGMGVAVVLCLARANWHRRRVVFHPNRGRIIGAVVLAAVTPVGVIAGVPSIIGFRAVIWFISLIGGAGGWSLFNLVAPLILIVVLLFWYGVSCLIVSGITSRWVRVAVFALMFWAAYSTVILIAGNTVFRT